MDQGSDSILGRFIYDDAAISVISMHAKGIFVNDLCRCLFVTAEILQANDNLTQVINLYKQLVKGEEINGETVGGPLQGEEAGEQGD